MDDYVRRQQILRGGERNVSVTRARSIDGAPRSTSVSTNQEDQTTLAKNVEVQDKEVKETKETKEDTKQKKKIAYKDDLIEVLEKIENVGKSLGFHKEESAKNLDKTNKNIVQSGEEIKKLVDELNKRIDSMKIDEEQTKAERVKNKLDNFITLYNENENIHSSTFIDLNKEIQKLHKRLSAIEDMVE